MRTADRNLVRGMTRLREGGAIILFDDERESEGDLAFAARDCTPELVNFCLKTARGVLCVAMQPDHARSIGVERVRGSDRSLASTPFGQPIDLAGLDHAASASGRAATIRATADETASKSQFVWPGHVATLVGNVRGLRGRTGHTECVLELLGAAGIRGPGVLCEILADDGEMAYGADLLRLSNEFDLPLVNLSNVRQLGASLGAETDRGIDARSTPCWRPACDGRHGD